MKQMQGAEILVRSLVEHGVEVIFGYPGGANLPIYDCLADFETPKHILGITLPITKHNLAIRSSADIAAAIQEAIQIATSGRPGPVLVDIPKDVLQEECACKPDKPLHLEGYQPVTRGHRGQIKKAANLLARKKKPVIIAGGGINRSKASAELLLLSRLLRAPVVYTLMGKSALPERYGLNYGMIGMHGTSRAVEALAQADLILVAGVRFGDRAVQSYEAFGKKADLIQIDVDPAEVDKNVKVNIPIVGDARNILQSINERLQTEQGLEPLQEDPAPNPEVPLEEGEDGLFNMPNIIRAVSDLNTDCIVVTDVGRHQMWAAKYYRSGGLKPGQFVSSSGLGTMGFGLPAALGAKTAFPDQKVLLFTGDGSFLMKIQELDTSLQHHLPILVIILNDQCLGMIHQLQHDHYQKRYRECSFPHRVDFVSIVRGFGLRGRTAENFEELLAAIEEGLASEKTHVIDCLIQEQINISQQPKQQ